MYFQEDVNVICVDWSAGAADPNYVRAAVNTRLVGKQVAILVENINESIGKSITPRTHIVGFSLGAHVAGFAGTQLKNLSRITGTFIVECIWRRGCVVEICHVPYCLFQVWIPPVRCLKATTVKSV